MRRRLRQEATEPASSTEFEKRDAYGFYVWTEVQPWQRWVFGLRYDWTEDPSMRRARMGDRPVHQLLHDGVPPVPAGVQAHGAVRLRIADTIDELLFQATFILGAHPADLF